MSFVLLPARGRVPRAPSRLPLAGREQPGPRVILGLAGPGSAAGLPVQWVYDQVEHAGRVPAGPPRAGGPGGRRAARTGVRRTPGLRREEVATLAGISADYYLRLEQGRDRNPSPQVLEALARVFGLDATATPVPAEPVHRPARGARRPRREVVPAGIRQLLDVLGLPAFVENRMFDVLAANRLATALSPGIRPGANRLRSMFLDEGERDLHPDWEHAIGGMVAVVPRVDRHRHRGSADRAASRRAVAGQRAVPAALGPARRQGARGRAGADAPPAGRDAGAAPGEAVHRRLGRPAAGDLSRRAGLGQRPVARAARLARRIQPGNRRGGRQARLRDAAPRRAARPRDLT